MKSASYAVTPKAEDVLLTKLRPPTDWPVGTVQVTCLRPESPAAALPPDAIALDRRTRTLRLRTPPFDTALILCIRPAKE